MLLEGMTKNLEKMVAARAAVDDALADVLVLRDAMAAEVVAEREAAKAAEAKAAEEVCPRRLMRFKWWV